MKKLLYFVSNSEEKFKELRKLAKGTSYDIKWFKTPVSELQTDNIEELLKHKALSAFKKIKRPVLVDHTMLEVEAFNSLPGPQISYFFEKLGNSEIVGYCNYKKKWKANAITCLCCCTGKKLISGKGIEEGEIVKKVDDSAVGYAWDNIFCPISNNNKRIVYAKLDKNMRSMRKKAWEELVKALDSEEIFSIEASKYRKSIEEVAELIAKKKMMLFIGAGISASIGLPSWKTLIEKLGKSAGYDADVFLEYGDNMLLAEYSELLGKGKLQEILLDEWAINRNAKLKKKLEDSAIYQYIMELNCPVIYTTNFDQMIEEYYKIKNKNMHKIAVIDHFEYDEGSYPRVMKFHGDSEHKESIVFTESQYFARMDYQSFMDIQLQADLLKYNVLFLGYSLSDINIKQLLYFSRKRWENTKTKKYSYIYTATPNYIQEKVFEKNNIVSISGEEADKAVATEAFLKELCAKVNEIKQRG